MALLTLSLLKGSGETLMHLNLHCYKPFFTLTSLLVISYFIFHSEMTYLHSVPVDLSLSYSVCVSVCVFSNEKDFYRES